MVPRNGATGARLPPLPRMTSRVRVDPDRIYDCLQRGQISLGRSRIVEGVEHETLAVDVNDVHLEHLAPFQSPDLPRALILEQVEGAAGLPRIELRAFWNGDLDM